MIYLKNTGQWGTLPGYSSTAVISDGLDGSLTLERASSIEERERDPGKSATRDRSLFHGERERETCLLPWDLPMWLEEGAWNLST